MNPDDEKLRSYFSTYYENLDHSPPDLLSSREIGFIPFGGTMVRHRGISGKEDLYQFAKNTVPRHFYYSTAYYRYPDNKKMSDKEWLGAELIFDLDADHIPGAEKLTYAEILSSVKKHTDRLLNKFLIGEFGFSEDELKLFFSGGRGYHVHVQSDKVYMLDSDARREIANYIRGEGLDQKGLLFEMRKQRNSFRGWFRLIDDSYTEFCRNISSGDPESLHDLDVFLGNRNSSRAFVNSMKSGVLLEKKIEKKENIFLREGTAKYEVMDERDKTVLQAISRRVVTSESSEIDEPVTTDVHRLIRFPLSLHGKTGLRVLPLTIDGFRGFDPLRDAIPDCFRDGSVKVNAHSDAKVTFDGDVVKLSQGVNDVPPYVAIFSVAQRIATFNLE